MEGKHKALLLLTCLCLLVTSINGIVDLSVKLRQTFTASAISDYDERLTVKVRCSSGRPSYAWWLMWCGLKATCSWHESLWRLAWRVGSQEVTTVENALTITVTGSNIQSPVSVDYYIEAKKPDGTALGKTLEASGASCSVGGSLTDSTGSVDIDQHLSSLGLATDQDQTVDYWVWVRVTATGLISGQQLVAEVGPVEFDSVFYDYGTYVTESFIPEEDAFGIEYYPDIVYDRFDLDVGCDTTLKRMWACLKHSLSGVSDVQSATLKLYVFDIADSGSPIRIWRCTSDWSESSLCWNTMPSAVDTGISTGNIDSKGWVSIDVTSIVQAWVNGTYDNYGLMLRGRELDEGDGHIRIYSSEADSNQLYFEVTYLSWTASWSWYPLPLSVVSLPIGRQLFWGLIIGLACFTLVVKLSKPKGGRKR